MSANRAQAVSWVNYLFTAVFSRACAKGHTSRCNVEVPATAKGDAVMALVLSLILINLALGFRNRVQHSGLQPSNATSPKTRVAPRCGKQLKVNCAC